MGFKTLPGSIAFQRGQVITEAVFTNSDNTPINVIMHEAMGPQNVNKDKKGSSNTEVMVETRIPYTTNTALTNSTATHFNVAFSVKFAPLENALYSTFNSKNDKENLSAQYREAIGSFTQKALNSESLKDLSCRYARNILNGRWLWKNRKYASNILITVREREGDVIASSNALTVSMNDFDGFSDAENVIGELILENLKGNTTTGLIVNAEVDFGVDGVFEIFPSQNKTPSKEKSLYCVNKAKYTPMTASNPQVLMGQAAFTGRKIANAIRTIDTWYSEYDDTGYPIATEINGASLSDLKFYRPLGKDKTSGFDIIKNINELDINSTDAEFLMSLFVRGALMTQS